MLWCGPCTVVAFTGAPLTVAEEALDMVGADCAATSNDDLSAAFSLFGFEMLGLMGFARGREPPLWRFLKMLDARRHAEVRLVIAIQLFDC